MPADGPWTTPSDLAEYAFCPRAHFYGRREEEPVSRAATAGEVYHRRRLASERWRDEHRRIPWLAVAAGVVLIGIAAAVLTL